MKRMLFNATQQEELRVAIVNGQKLIDIDIETTGRELRKSNIYKGVITRIEPSLEACFVNYGEERHGFLPFKEVARSYFKEGIDVRNSTIKDALREGQEIIVQVEKEERGNKGAALTSFISLAGRYLVLMPNNPRGGGVSRRVEGEDRQELRETMDKLDLPAGMSVIARTAGIGRNVDELQWDLNYLMQLWRAIDGAGKSGQGAFLIYQESSLVIRAIRDYFQPDIGEILIDTDDIYEQAQQFMSHVMPDMVHRVKRYSDDVPLFSRFQIEHQIETAYSRTVPLPSGGAIVIDHTEALVSVDVNSARATRGGDIETTAFNTNLEAAEEVARQLRLRDLGGLIVIDFIDMENAKNQREVETRLKDALRYDRARVQMGKISRFGLMELSRQRLRPSLSEGSHVTCPRCNGTGHIRDTESSALQVLRIIQEEAMKENSAAIHVQVPVDVAAFLLNEKRGEILKIETRHRVTAILIPNKHLETPHYKLDRLKHDDPRLEEAHASYAMAEQVDTDIGYNKRQKDDVKPRQEAVVKTITPETAPIVERKPEPTKEVAKESGGLFAGIAKFFSSLFGSASEAAPAVEEKPKHARDKNDRNRQRNRQRNRGRNGNGAENEERNSKGNDKSNDRANDKSVDKSADKTSDRVSDKEQKSSSENNQQRQNKQQQRPAREEKEGQESRRERQQKQRDARKENNAEAKQEDLAVASAAPSITAAAATTPSHKPKLTESSEATADVENADAPSTEEGRRRRRGGRNRNRRDRHAAENAEMTTTENNGEVAVAAPPAFIPVVDLLQSEAASADSKPVQSSLDLAPEAQSTASAATAPQVTAPAAPEATTTEVITEVAEVVSTTVAPAAVEAAQVANEASATAEVKTVEPSVAESNLVANAEPVTTAASIEAAPTQSTASEAAQSEVSVAPQTPAPTEVIAPAAVATETVAAVTEVVAEIAAEVTATTTTAEVSPAPVPVQADLLSEVAVAPQVEATASVTPVETVPAPVGKPAIQKSDRVEDLSEVLAKAGLVLASTDPIKLKAAQEAAVQTTVAPRVIRERKAATAVSNEPLVQVETKR
ncbi:Rne/Rng family ribonuclease [Undibacterium cyanobacteriorum]|uniref:Ribonuclease E n=1 Tax=Undibacterium cyanobacteriorum TaxID=3073561 RepID=A0ABY9RE16_9BURK|nr:Rne/Rng family ribonuclease [Undibacterium sp. 20NA77.5]WMW79201.1 Rne/Rng family ribonuclease [Undibacterium sp. 20NA77.5]